MRYREPAAGASRTQEIKKPITSEPEPESRAIIIGRQVGVARSGCVKAGGLHDISAAYNIRRIVSGIWLDWHMTGSVYDRIGTKPGFRVHAERHDEPDERRDSAI